MYARCLKNAIVKAIEGTVKETAYLNTFTKSKQMARRTAISPNFRIHCFRMEIFSLFNAEIL